MGSKTQEILAEYRAELARTMGEKAKGITVTKPGVWVYVDSATTGRIGSYRLTQIVQMIEELKQRPSVV